jgi:hypothetical protein
MTYDGANQVDGIEYDAGLSIVHNSDAINIASLTIRRRGRKYANQRGRKWLNLLLPSGWQMARSIIFLPQALGKIAGAGVIALNSTVVLTPEVAGSAVTTLVIALLILLVVLAFAITLALVFGKEANGRQRTNPKQGNQELPPIHISLSSN